MVNTIELDKEKLISIINNELDEVKERNNEEDRGLFVSKLENTRDLVNHATTDEELKEVYKNQQVQDIIRDFRYKKTYK